MSILLFGLCLINSGFLPSVDTAIYIKNWSYLGPFSMGVRENVIDADAKIEEPEYRPETGEKYATILSPAGYVCWRDITSDSGVIKIELNDVPWDSLQDIYGHVGLLNVTYVWSEFEAETDSRALISAQGIGSFVHNGRSYPGDAYQDGIFLMPVILKNGRNTILLKLSGYGGHAVSFKIMPALQPLRIVAEDVLLPDLIAGEKNESYLGVPVMNTTEKYLENISISVTGELIEPALAGIRRLVPLSCCKIPVALRTKYTVQAGDSTMVCLKVESGDIVSCATFWIKIKRPDEAHCRTFLSAIDNSCQYYAVLPPKHYSEDSTYALIMTCHGAGVEARGQVGAYTQKDWAFVVAPTNRRRFGFDWQDWGRLDFLEVLSEAKKNYKIDENRVYLTGHSMGGHGTWHIGLAHPDLFAAIAPSAGWTTIQLYAPFTLQKSYLFAEPEQLKYRDMVMREDNPLLYLENALNLPVYVLHGGADDNVPPVQARLMNKYLSKWHKNYVDTIKRNFVDNFKYPMEYDPYELKEEMKEKEMELEKQSEKKYGSVFNEVSGMGHWWDVDSTPGVDCVDLKEMMIFLKDQTRDSYPKKVIIKMQATERVKKCYWVEIDELEDFFQGGKIEAEISAIGGIFHDPLSYCPDYSRSINIKANNIKKFKILLSSGGFFPTDGHVYEFSDNNKKWMWKDTVEIEGHTFVRNTRKIRVNIRINDQEWIYDLPREDIEISFYKDGDKYKIRKQKQDQFKKTQMPYGPVKRAYFSPFLFVYGTAGDSSSAENNLHLARNYASTWWMRGNGFAEIVPDSLITEKEINDYNFILFGNSRTNSYVKKVNRQLPIQMDQDHFVLGGKKITGDDLCMMVVYPNPLNKQKLVLVYAPSSAAAEEYLGLFPVLYSGSGLPDFIVWDRSVLSFGWAGVVACGFFDQAWRLDKNSMFVKK